METGPLEGRDKSDGSEATTGDAAIPAFVAIAFEVGGKAVEIDDEGRLVDPFRNGDVEFDGIRRTPFYAREFPGEGGIGQPLAKQGLFDFERAGIQFDGSPIFMKVAKIMLGKAGDSGSRRRGERF